MSQPNIDQRTLERMDRLDRIDGWNPSEFPLAGRAAPNTFEASTAATRGLRIPGCKLILPGATQSVFNRTTTSSAPGDYRIGPCSKFRDVLVFVKSRLGHHYYLGDRRSVSYYQLEGDPYRPGNSFSAFGRYALFRVLHPTPGARIQIDLTNTLAGNGSNKLPPLSVIGTTRSRLPTVGRGSARVYSGPVRPLVIDGAPYLLIDMGIRGETPHTSKEGLSGLYGKNVPIDNRVLTTRVRNLSLIPASNFRRQTPPQAVSEFPAGLADPELEFSGIYEDGWVAESSFFVLSARRGQSLRVAGQTRPDTPGQRLQIFIDGRKVARRTLAPGPFEIDIPVTANGLRRRVELRFAQTKPLPAPDSRPAAAMLSFVGFTSPELR